MSQQQPSKGDFINNPNHIYNKLCEKPEQTRLDFGWKVLTLEIAANLKLDGMDCDGITEFEECAIKLDSELNDADARETIIHEILHCLMEGAGIHEKNFGTGFINLTNEFLADTLAKQLVQFNNLNPGVLETIMSHDI